MIKSKKQMFLVIGIFTLVLFASGVTYAFFNYTRTGAGNTIRVGRIAFESSQTGSINLTNAFPITSEEAETDTTNAKSVSITVTGDTDYTGGVEYVVTASDVNLEVNGKQLPIALEISVEGNNSKTLGTVETGDYYTNRENYSVSKYKIEYDGEIEEGAHLLVGYIAPNTTSGTAEGVDGVINIKAYIDASKVLISDTYDGTESEINGTPNSMAEGKTVFTTTEWNSLNSNGVSFKLKVEANEGIWVKEPLTAVGQIIKEVNTTTQINFGNISSDTNGQGLYILPGTESDVNPIYYYRGAVTNNNVIFGGFCWQMVRTTDTGGIKMIYNGVVTGNGETCENTAHADRIIASIAFNISYNSPAYVGYMYNQRYTYTSGAAASNSIFGKNVEWNDSTSTYLVIEDTSGTASTNTTKDANHHYSCGTASTSSCASVRYYYYNNYYITLTNGDTIEDALYKMTGNGSASTKAKNAAGYKLNTTDSNAKAEIENWFKTNLTNEVDASKTNYQEYLEDTVFCNNRSYKTVTGAKPTYEQSGWNPNGGDIKKYLYFGTWNRFYNSYYSTTNVPSMACENVTDRFSVSNQEAKLKYPVGLLTADEIILAGAAGNSYAANTTYYLYTGNYYWSLSPISFNIGNAFEFSVSSTGDLGNGNVEISSGLRPVVSLKLGTEFEDGGDGTALKPYVVKTRE